jgi:dTDP-glucose pyrophosphorylase
MKDLSNHTIRQTATVLEALKQLNDLPTTLTLFVLDEADRLVGTVTDGDIRRGLLQGLTLAVPIQRFMLSHFQSITPGFTLADFKQAKAKGIRLLPLLDQAGRLEKVYDLKKQQSILPMDCVIMAGGRGERLRPLTDTQPKPMLPLGGKPILEHTIDRLISFGIETIYLSVKYLGQQLVDYFGDGSSKGIRINYLWENQPLGTAGSLSLVESFKTAYILLMNSDLFTDANYEDLYLNVLATGAAMGVATVPYSTKIPYGILTTNGTQVTTIKEKPIYTNYVNAGIYVIRRDVLDRIPQGRFYNATDLIETLLQEQQTVVHTPLVGYWIDIGQPQDYLNAQEIVKHVKHD